MVIDETKEHMVAIGLRIPFSDFEELRKMAYENKLSVSKCARIIFSSGFIQLREGLKLQEKSRKKKQTSN